MAKYIFVAGGVLSGVGKGVTSASIGAILKSMGYSVTAMKIDPYINVDAGTMNPTEHGEVFVTDDGDETDQDMGNYERFLNVNLTRDNYMTTGRVYLSVIEKERAMAYGGRCVEVVPHIPLEVIERFENGAKKNNAEIVLIEVGGTIGEYQNILFLEAYRMMKLKNPDDLCFIMVSYLPIPSHLGEMKTKPTQHAARDLNEAGIQPDIIVARGAHELDAPRKEKLAVFCGVRESRCISAPDVDSIYRIPLTLSGQNLETEICKILKLEPRKPDLSEWENLDRRIAGAKTTIKIAIVGKYFGTGDFTLADSYISVIESIKFAAWNNDSKVELTWMDSEDFERGNQKVSRLGDFDGVIVPGGFGSRGISGILSAIQYVRENKIPYLGLCYGMQLACIEFARNVLGLGDAHSIEVNPETTDPVIHINPTQMENIRKSRYGGTMRLGQYACTLTPGTKVFEEYGRPDIMERHRHRYEFNNDYRQRMEEKGMKFVGINRENNLVEIIELENHPWFVACQFHPEFKSRPFQPHPLFSGFVKTILKKGL